eukprot:PhF_6_TR42695/c0_g1_i8/m.64445
MTEHVRMHYIKQQIERGLMASNALQDIHVMSLQASYDPGQPLYFWQLFSLLGQARIEKPVRSFYTKVFNDTENAWFRDHRHAVRYVDRYHGRRVILPISSSA